MSKSTIIFLALNFFALFLGSQFTNVGVSSDWYAELNKAPWTPPGWVFGAAWTTIMICFAVFMGRWYDRSQDTRRVLTLYGLQWILNVAWNPLFFHWRLTDVALVSIISLTVVVLLHWRYARPTIGHWALLIMPYILWFIIATSLNAYISLYN